MANFSFAFHLSLFLVFGSSHGSTRGALRLVRNGQTTLSQAWNSGIVQIYYNNAWGNICDDGYFGSNEADVICHQLSYTGASSYTYTANSFSSYGADNSNTAIEDVSCSSSNLLVLLQCSVSSQYSSFCSGDTDDVIVDCYSTRIWDSAYTGQIRLSSGQYSNEGLLEIYCNGQWGTVCDDSFDPTDATVACRQLGYNTYSSYTSYTVSGSFTQPIWLDSVYCISSSDTCLTECETCPASEYHDCVHSEDVNLKCTYSSSASLSSVTEETCQQPEIDTTGPSSVGSMRLLNSGSTSLYNTAGRVQVWYGGQWGNICDDFSFSSNEADVVCHQLGWSGASSYSSGTSDGYGTDNLPTVIDDLSCSQSSYLTIFQCSYSSSIDSGCSNDNNDVAVTCYSTRIWDSAYTGQIRLSGGQYSNEGLLEMYCNGQWGTVCDNSFDPTDANVACRQLGYNTYYSYLSHTVIGNTSQPIWLNNVYCSSSSYNCLSSCATCPSAGYSSCGHNEDVNLECSDQSYRSVYTTTSTCDEDAPTSSAGSGSGDGLVGNGLVGGIVGGILGVIFISIAIPVCIICCVAVVAPRRARRATPFTRAVATSTVTDIQLPAVQYSAHGYPSTTNNPPPPNAGPGDNPPAPYPYHPFETTPTAPSPYPPLGPGVDYSMGQQQTPSTFQIPHPP